jgi:hypothetical protein
MKRNPALEAAIEECNKACVPYSTKETRDNHVMLFIGNNGKIITISDSRAARDTNWIKNVRSDVRKAIRQLTV